MDGDGARDLSAAPVQRQPRQVQAKHRRVLKQIERRLFILDLVVCRRKGTQNFGEEKDSAGRTDQAVSPNGPSAAFRFPRATGKVRPPLHDIKLALSYLVSLRLSLRSSCLSLAVGVLPVSP